jgi:hypothetical protein
VKILILCMLFAVMKLSLRKLRMKLIISVLELILGTFRTLSSATNPCRTETTGLYQRFATNWRLVHSGTSM